MSFILVGTGPSRLGLQFKGFGERLYGLRTLGFKGVGFRAGRPSIEFRGILCRCPEAFEENVQISKKDVPQDKAWVARTVVPTAICNIPRNLPRRLRPLDWLKSA